MKHNKKRNTAFIYEALARTLTRAIVDKDADRKKQVTSILKEHFPKGSVLATELQLYQMLLETANLQRPVAERMLQEAKVAYNTLNESAIFDAQSELIKAVNKTLGQDTWNTFIPNFKSLASVNTIFNPKASVKKRVLFEQATVDRMSAQREPTAASEMEPLDRLTYGSFINKFNDKYGTLLQEQKDLLNHYIVSFADDGFEMRVYLNEELSRLKDQLNTFDGSELGTLVTEKIEKVQEYLEEFRRREFTDTDLKKVLKTQELVEELAGHDNN
jgi:hypothetical protein|tara:strand:+ start:124 stop:942 length:819 start_codon:yes stop_codon:yes gene_type:complete